MSVNETAVEAGARAMHKLFEQRTERRQPFYTRQSWDAIGDECRAEFLNYVRPALEAADPHMHPTTTKAGTE